MKHLTLLLLSVLMIVSISCGGNKADEGAIYILM